MQWVHFCIWYHIIFFGIGETGKRVYSRVICYSAHSKSISSDLSMVIHPERLRYWGKVGSP